jgi:hypothetical protein
MKKSKRKAEGEERLQQKVSTEDGGSRFLPTNTRRRITKDSKFSIQLLKNPKPHIRFV